MPGGGSRKVGDTAGRSPTRLQYPTRGPTHKWDRSREPDLLDKWGAEARGGLVCSCGRNSCKTCNPNKYGTRGPLPDKSVDEKKCLACGDTKRAVAFYRNRSQRDGLQTMCIECTRLRDTERRG